ncbi:MAG: HelD family protein [Propionibacteriaceae bacterium]
MSTPQIVERELAIEQAHVDRVYTQLETAQRSAETLAERGNAMHQIDRSDWARDEEQGTAMFERDAFSFQAAKRLAILDSEHDGLVFGRLDLTDEDIRYIGRIGVRDDDYEPLVIDWRAPASEPFYRATPSAPMGVARRRVLRCRGERVIGIEDDLMDATAQREDLAIVGEGALMAALSRARGSQMRDIVATIQGEQDEAIRAPYQGVTVITGGPGTGKTVVALHRAAYLLYSNRRRFEKGGVLVVGPSGVFMNYIERVLPSLGEESVALHAIGSVASDVVRHRTERIDTPDAAAIKGSLAMVALLKKLVAEPLPDSPHALRVVVKGDILSLNTAQLLRIRNDVLASRQVNKARKAAETAILNALWLKLPEDIDIERDEFNELVSEQQAFTTFMPLWWPVLTPEKVLARLSDRECVINLGTDLTEHQIEALTTSWTDLDPDAQHWSVADMALLDEIFSLLGPAPVERDDYDPTEFLEHGSDFTELVSTADMLSRHVEIDPDDEGHRTYAHVLIDEAQDITPMQWRMLRRRGPQASWTIVGDPAQSSWPYPAETDEALHSLIGSAPNRTFHMSTNYRSPAEVFDLAGRMITRSFPQADLPRPVRATGHSPQLLQSSQKDLAQVLVNQIHQLGEQVDGTIGVIAVPSRHRELEEALTAATRNDSELAHRVNLLTPLEVKGLEYDAAIVIDPDGIVANTQGGDRVLYVALTRPTQRLTTIDITGSHWREGL